MKKITDDMIIQKLLDDIPKTSMELEMCFNHRISKIIIARILNKSEKVEKVRIPFTVWNGNVIFSAEKYRVKGKSK